MKIAFALLALSVLGLTSCATTDPTQTTASSPLRAESPVGIKVPRDHTEAIETFSSGDSEFAGLYNTFELKATLLNSTVREALIRRQSEYYQWDASQVSSEREKAMQELSNESVLFVSFATPERKNDNLADKKSIWRLFLDVGGRRYVGTAKKDRRLIAELQSLFPYHTRWNTPYTFSFPVGMNAIENQSMKLTVTGPLGSRVLEFRAPEFSVAPIAPNPISSPESTSTITEPTTPE